MDRITEEIKWFWHDYGLLGVCCVFLAAVLIVGIFKLLHKHVFKKLFEKRTNKLMDIAKNSFTSSVLFDGNSIYYEYRDWDHVMHRTKSRFMAETMSRISGYNSDTFSNKKISEAPGRTYTIAEILESPNVFDNKSLKYIMEQTASDCTFAKLYTKFSGKFGVEQFHTCVGPVFLGQYSERAATNSEAIAFERYRDGLFRKFTNRKTVDRKEQPEKSRIKKLYCQKDVFGVRWSEMSVNGKNICDLPLEERLEAKREYRDNQKDQMSLDTINFILIYIGYKKG